MKRSKAYHARRGLGVLAAASLMASFAVGAIGAAPAAVSSTSAAASTTSAAADPAAAHGGTTGWGTGTLTEADLHALVSQMTLSEEIGMVHGEGDPPNSAAANASCAASAVGCVGEAGWIPGVARLGIPPLRMTDGPAGIRLRHVETAMPAPVGLAATFDRATAGQYGATVGLAGRATNQDVWLGPMINAVNYPTAGRNFETLGEDPYLASQLVAREVKGVQSTGLVAELKHYIENDFENGRGSTSVAIDDQTLHETELQAFAAGIAAGAGSLMCSYNRINNIYGCGNSDTLGEILRQQLAFTGFVQSDWGAIHKTTDLFYGADIEQPGNAAGTSNFGNALMTAVTNGTPAVDATSDFPAYPAISASQWKSALDTAVFHILTTMNKAGLLEGTQYGSHFTGTPAPYVPPRPDLASLQQSEFAAARAIAEESATLLKNDGGALPLSGADLYGKGHSSGVAVMGPTAIAPYVGGGGSAHVTPYDPAQGPYDALAAAAGRRANLTYVPGYDLDGQVVPSSAVSAPDPAANYPNWTLTAADAAFAGKPGLLRQQTTTDAVASGAQPVLYTGSDAPPDQLDTTVDYTGANTLPAGTAWRWSGLLTAPANPGGTGWQLKVFVKNQARAQLFIDGLTVGGAGNARRINIGAYPAAPSTSYAALAENARSHDPANETLQQGTYAITLSPGQQIHLDLRLVTGTAPAQIQLRWVPPDDQATSIAQAAAAAKNAHKVIVFAYDDGTEGRDRGISDQAAGLELPGYQDDLIQAVAAANPNTVVVLNSGDPVLMPWASSVKSVLEMWYPGQQGGQATAGVLLGRANPGGKLPVTFPADGTHFPTYDPNCTDTSVTGNCPLYPGVAGPSPFLTGTTTSYRTIIGMAVNGIFEGYRWYDQHNVAPLYPFGYGLSYTTFAYSRLRVSGSRDGGLDVSFRVTNTGDRAGSDVPQVYVGPSSQLPSGIQQAVRRLVQFQRVELGPGRSATLTLHVTPHDLSSWSSAQQKWVVGTGLRTVYAGPSSRDLPLQATVMVRAR
ncbi:MAG: beta-glucosidase family protein [Micromonosporaceae bacterium]